MTQPQFRRARTGLVVLVIATVLAMTVLTLRQERAAIARKEAKAALAEERFDDASVDPTSRLASPAPPHHPHHPRP